MTYRAYHKQLGTTIISKEEFKRHRSYFPNRIKTTDFVDDPMKWIIRENGKRVQCFLIKMSGMETTIYF